MHAKLSSKISVAIDCGYPKSQSVSHRYTTSWSAWLAATNSATEVERETLSCQRLFQEMGPPFTESLKYSQCEIDECLCRQPNQYQPNPTIHLHDDFRGCKWWFRSKLPVFKVEHVHLPACVTVQGIERLSSTQNMTKPGLGVSLWQDNPDFPQYLDNVCGNRVWGKGQSHLLTIVFLVLLAWHVEG